MPIVDANGMEGFDFLDVSQPLQMVVTSPTATSAGQTITAAFPQVPYDYFLMVDQIAVSCTSTTTTTAKVYVDTPLQDSNVIASTLAGNLDQDDVNSPIVLLPTKIMSVSWFNCSIGAVGTVRIQARAKVLTPAGNQAGRNRTKY